MLNGNWTPEGVYEHMQKVHGKILTKEQCKRVTWFINRAKHLAKKTGQGIEAGIQHAEREMKSLSLALQTAIGEAKIALQQNWPHSQPIHAKDNFSLEKQQSQRKAA